MSRGRFALVVVLLVIAAGAASFAAVYVVLDDDAGSPSGADAGGSSTTVAPITTTTTAPGGLATPTFVVIVSSEADEATAQGIRDELTEGGYTANVLHSDDFPSLEAGYWVAYTGPFSEVAAAETEKDALIADGYTAAYARCVGTANECG